MFDESHKAAILALKQSEVINKYLTGTDYAKIQKELLNWLIEYRQKNTQEKNELAPLARMIAYQLALAEHPENDEAFLVRSALGKMYLRSELIMHASIYSITAKEFLAGIFVAQGLFKFVTILSLPIAKDPNVPLILSVEDIDKAFNYLEDSLKSTNDSNVNLNDLAQYAQNQSAREVLALYRQNPIKNISEIPAFLKKINHTQSRTGYTGKPFATVNAMCAQMAYLCKPESQQAFWQLLYPEINEVIDGHENNIWPNYGEALYENNQILNYREIRQNAISTNTDIYKHPRVQTFMSADRKFWVDIENLRSKQKKAPALKKVTNYYQLFEEMLTILKEYSKDKYESEISLEGYDEIEPFVKTLLGLPSGIRRMVRDIKIQDKREETLEQFIVNLTIPGATNVRSCFNANSTLLTNLLPLIKTKFEGIEFIPTEIPGLYDSTVTFYGEDQLNYLPEHSSAITNVTVDLLVDMANHYDELMIDLNTIAAMYIKLNKNSTQPAKDLFNFTAQLVNKVHEQDDTVAKAILKIILGKNYSFKSVLKSKSDIEFCKMIYFTAKVGNDSKSQLDADIMAASNGTLVLDLDEIFKLFPRQSYKEEAEYFKIMMSVKIAKITTNDVELILHHFHNKQYKLWIELHYIARALIHNFGFLNEYILNSQIEKLRDNHVALRTYTVPVKNNFLSKYQIAMLLAVYPLVAIDALCVDLKESFALNILTMADLKIAFRLITVQEDGTIGKQKIMKIIKAFNREILDLITTPEDAAKFIEMSLHIRYKLVFENEDDDYEKENEGEIAVSTKILSVIKNVHDFSQACSAKSNIVKMYLYKLFSGKFRSLINTPDDYLVIIEALNDSKYTTNILNEIKGIFPGFINNLDDFIKIIKKTPLGVHLDLVDLLKDKIPTFIKSWYDYIEFAYLLDKNALNEVKKYLNPNITRVPLMSNLNSPKQNFNAEKWAFAIDECTTDEERNAVCAYFLKIVKKQISEDLDATFILPWVPDRNAVYFLKMLIPELKQSSLYKNTSSFLQNVKPENEKEIFATLIDILKLSVSHDPNNLDNIASRFPNSQELVFNSLQPVLGFFIKEKHLDQLLRCFPNAKTAVIDFYAQNREKDETPNIGMLYDLVNYDDEKLKHLVVYYMDKMGNRYDLIKDDAQIISIIDLLSIEDIKTHPQMIGALFITIIKTHKLSLLYREIHGDDDKLFQIIKTAGQSIKDVRTWSKVLAELFSASLFKIEIVKPYIKQYMDNFEDFGELTKKLNHHYKNNFLKMIQAEFQHLCQTKINSLKDYYLACYSVLEINVNNIISPQIIATIKLYNTDQNNKPLFQDYKKSLLDKKQIEGFYLELKTNQQLKKCWKDAKSPSHIKKETTRKLVI